MLNKYKTKVTSSKTAQEQLTWPTIFFRSNDYFLTGTDSYSDNARLELIS